MYSLSVSRDLAKYEKNTHLNWDGWSDNLKLTYRTPSGRKI